MCQDAFSPLTQKYLCDLAELGEQVLESRLAHVRRDVADVQRVGRRRWQRGVSVKRRHGGDGDAWDGGKGDGDGDPEGGERDGEFTRISEGEPENGHCLKL